MIRVNPRNLCCAIKLKGKKIRRVYRYEMVNGGYSGWVNDPIYPNPIAEAYVSGNHRISVGGYGFPPRSYDGFESMMDDVAAIEFS